MRQARRAPARSESGTATMSASLPVKPPSWRNKTSCPLMSQITGRHMRHRSAGQSVQRMLKMRGFMRSLRRILRHGVEDVEHPELQDDARAVALQPHHGCAVDGDVRLGVAARHIRDRADPIAVGPEAAAVFFAQLAERLCEKHLRLLRARSGMNACYGSQEVFSASRESLQGRESRLAGPGSEEEPDNAGVVLFELALDELGRHRRSEAQAEKRVQLAPGSLDARRHKRSREKAPEDSSAAHGRSGRGLFSGLALGPLRQKELALQLVLRRELFFFDGGADRPLGVVRIDGGVSAPGQVKRELAARTGEKVLPQERNRLDAEEHDPFGL